MKLDKNRAYEELDKRLKVQVESSINAVHIDEVVKDRMWDNLYSEMKEERLKRKFTVRRTYRVAIAACLVMVLLVSLDLSSNASLFKRLLTSVSGNAIQFHTRDSKPYEENRDEDLDNKINEINEKNGTYYISPTLVDSYKLKDVVEKGSNLFIFLINDNNDVIKITQKSVNNGGAGTLASYDKESFGITILNKNGIEYNMLMSDKINIALFSVGNIEVEVKGLDYESVLDIAVALHN